MTAVEFEEALADLCRSDGCTRVRRTGKSGDLGAYVGSRDGSVYALNAATGAKLWSYATGSGVDSSPAVANGVVYIGSTDNNIYAFDLAAGQQALNRPGRSGLHPHYSLHLQR